MSGKKIKYPEETKRKAVEEFNSGKKSAQQLADELGYKDTTRIYSWKAQYAEASKGRQVLTDDPKDSNSDLLRRLSELEMENDELKKSLGEKSLIIDLLKKLPGNSLYEKNANGLTKTIKDLAVKKKAMEIMELSSSTYYKEKSFSSSGKEEMEADIRGQIESVRVEFPRAGYRTLLKYLERRGIIVTEYRLRKVLKKFSLHIKPKRRFVRTTDSNHGHKIYPNILGDHQVTKLNEAWVADITYIRIANGFVYLAVVLDLHSRVVVGWQISQRIDGELALDALKMAYERRNRPIGVIHHSDRGVQYLCDKYINFLTHNEFKISCSRKGNPYDNAFAESFMKTIKTEEVYLFNYDTILDVAQRIGRFIKEVYNEKRVHSSLNYLTPKEFENLIKVE